MRRDIFYGVQFAQSRYELEKRRRKSSCLKFDFPTTQYIEEGIDENHATGHWTTVSFEFDGQTPGSDMYVVIGQYANEFVLENHIWSLQKVCFESKYKCGPFQSGKDAALDEYLKNTGSWAAELPELTSLENMEISPKTLEILRLRNHLQRMAGKFNQTGKLDAEPDFDMKAVMEKLCSLMKKVKTLLVTSPVVRMSDGLEKAEAFFSVNALSEECSAGNGVVQIRSTRGSLYLELYRSHDKWQVQTLDWYNFASLEPWEKVQK